MASNTPFFDSINKKLGPFRPSQGDTLTWYRETARSLGSMSRATPDKLLAAEDIITFNAITRDIIGSLVCWFYDPKHKATLPYYDTFPMAFIVDMKKDGWYAINLHYLPHLERARLMDALYRLRSDKTVDDSTRLRISYGILKESSRLKLFAPCFKRYLASHARSQFKRISPKDWDKVLQMPLARFMKASQEKVWTDSIINVRAKYFRSH
jgi:hypothetical protein